MDRDSPDDAPDRTGALAAVLGWDPLVFAQTFGAGWSECPSDDTDADIDLGVDVDPSDELGEPATPWHVSGEPPQLMIRASRLGVVVAIPQGAWHSHTLVHRPHHETSLGAHLDPGHIDRTIRDLLRRRRSSFRYCRFCREVTAPERLIGDTCHGCATAWHGIVC